MKCPINFRSMALNVFAHLGMKVHFVKRKSQNALQRCARMVVNAVILLTGFHAGVPLAILACIVNKPLT